MTEFTAEFIGTTLLMLIGTGVNINARFRGTNGHPGDWSLITIGWGMAVFVAVFIVSPFSGAHINPAVTIGLAIANKFNWSLVPLYLLAQMLGAMTGSFWAWLVYRQHFHHQDSESILGVFSTGPQIRSFTDNLFSEATGTFVLVFGVVYIAAPDVGLGALQALPVGLLVVAIGMGLGGTTGYAINPARDLGPRIIHALLPIQGKGRSDWAYAWIPVAGPFLGAILAAWGYLFLNKFLY